MNGLARRASALDSLSVDAVGLLLATVGSGVYSQYAPISEVDGSPPAPIREGTRELLDLIHVYAYRAMATYT